jgi:valyl-tRNA synthetase
MAENPAIKCAKVEGDLADVKKIIEKMTKLQITFEKVKTDIATSIAKVELVVDAQEAAKNIGKQIEHLENEILRGQRMLLNPGFINKAPKALIEEERQKLVENQNLLRQLKGGAR